MSDNFKRWDQRPFRDHWKKAIHDLAAQDMIDRARGIPRISPRTHSAFKEFPEVSRSFRDEQVSRWRKGSTVSLKSGKGILHFIRIAEEVALLQPRQASLLIASYVEYLHSFGERALTTARKSLSSHSIKSPRDLFDWISSALYVRLLVLEMNPEMAFRETLRLWSISREGYDIPSEVFYAFRKAAFAAKSSLVIQDKLIEMAGILEDHFHVQTEPPRFRYFIKKLVFPAVNYQVEAVLANEFVSESFGGNKIKNLLYSKYVNDLLIDGALSNVKLAYDQTRYAIPQGSETFAWLALVDSMNRDSDLFNGHKVRLSKVLSQSVLNGDKIKYHHTDYFSTEVTNRSCHLEFEHQVTGELVRLVDDDGLPLSPENMSCQIGVMACILTHDGYLVSMYQDKTCSVSGDELVPFGGSVEYFDIELFSEPTLGDLIAYTIRREVKEEAVVRVDSIDKVFSVGYTLDSGKGLKPDFFGLALVQDNWSDIKDNREEFYGGPLVGAKLDLNSANDFKQSLELVRDYWRSSSLNAAAFLDANLKFLVDASDRIYDQLELAGMSSDSRRV